MRAGVAAVTELQHVCMPLVDDDGQVVARVRASPDLDERGRQALLNVVAAARRLMAEQDAADPEAAAERARRQEAAIARIRERAAKGRQSRRDPPP